MACQSKDHFEPYRFSDKPGRLFTYAVDQLQPTRNPPGLNGVVDFEGGGRLACELTDCDPGSVAVGMPVEMTFRRLSRGREIVNYFWKAKARFPGRGGKHKGACGGQHKGQGRYRGHGMHAVRGAMGRGVGDLLVEAAYEAFEDAGISPGDVQAAWLGTVFSGMSALAMSGLGLQYIPVTQSGKHVRNRHGSPPGRRLCRGRGSM